MNLRIIGLIVLLAAGYSCNDTDNKKVASPNSETEVEGQRLDSNHVEVDFNMNGVFYSVVVPKGALIDDHEAVFAYIYLEPGDENRMIVSPGQPSEVGMKESENGFQYKAASFSCMYAKSETEDSECIEVFKKIAQSIKVKSRE